MTVLALSLVILTSVASAAKAQTSTHHEALRGHQIWQLPGDVGPVALELLQKGLLDVLARSGTSRKVRVPPQFLEEARRILQERGVAHEILTEDLATFLENHERQTKRSTNSESCDPNACPRPFRDNYMTFEQMEWFLKQLCERSPRASLASIGKTNENRDIWMVRLRLEDPEEDSEEDAEAASAVWIEAGIHAREWISSAVALHLLETLLRDGGDVGNFDVHVVPMANPDGYEYSRMHNRLWRKNRRTTSKADCAGVDLNRNWSFQYGAGASENECSEVFMGTEPFSEPETKALRDAMTRVKDQLKLVLCLHSYGQQLLYPWGYSTMDVAPHTDDLVREGKVFAEAAQYSDNTSYAVVNAASGLYVASGTTSDWSLGALGVKYSYTLELRDEGEQGFLLDPSNIVPCTEEVRAGLQALLKKII
ncbi:carboxypeptidase B-like [Penaeus chinensis]|uniref:carboxypeptidase B-like n=1 Tax=Penaeus chinensis TaxID=139456 RepID=UPI001FB74977|nr:carboxypeptidase B-like [Penaeus chinensis]